jgi:hypothetical protein
MVALPALFSAMAIDLALLKSHGNYDRTSVLVVCIGMMTAFAGVAARRDSSISERAMGWSLFALTIGNLLILGTHAPGLYIAPHADTRWFTIGVGAAVAVVLSYLAPATWLARWRFPAAVVVYLALAVWMIRASPSPAIDVWADHQRASEALLHGANPYGIDYPNAFGGARVVAYPYLPWGLLLGAIGYAVAGDVRFVLAAATAGAAVVLVLTLRRMGRPAGDRSELAAILLMFPLGTYFALEQGWTDPFLLLGAALVAYTQVRGRATSWALAAMLSAKQYSIFMLPLVAGARRMTIRQIAAACGLGLAVAVPFLVSNARGFWNGAIMFQLESGFRDDSLSVLAAIARRFHVTPPLWCGLPVFAGFTAAVAFALDRRAQEGRTELSRLMLAAVAAYLCVFLFSKQAFFNYYWFAHGLSAISLALVVGERISAPS